MSAPGRCSRARGRELAPAIALALAIVLAPASALAQDCNLIYFPAPDQLFYLNDHVPTQKYDQENPYWAVWAVRSFAPTSDYDQYLGNFSGCTWNQIVGSAFGGGTTDLVVGDFNHTPLGTTFGYTPCFSGACESPGTYGWATWRPGNEVMTVGAAAQTIDFTAGPPYSADALVRTWDVYLYAGQTYFFQFSSTLGSSQQMLLFRNPTGGTYYASRAGAVFATSGCTFYTAPTTGYYGLVVVNDAFALGVFTIGVFTSPQCACGTGQLVSDTPVVLPPNSGGDYEWYQQGGPYWTVVGVRPDAGSDWDLHVGDTGSPPQCIGAIQGSSASGVNTTDIVVSDFNHIGTGSLAVNPFHFSGSGGATVEWHEGQSSLFQNDARVIENWSTSEVAHCWDVFLNAGQDYTFQLYTSNPNVKFLLYQNPGTGPYSGGRGAAVFSTSTDIDYTAPADGYYGLVAVKDDDQPATISMRYGLCTTPTNLPASAEALVAYRSWLDYTASAGRWSAVTVNGSPSDWDITQYGNGPAATWPDCFSPTLAISSSSTVPDVIAGDFHHNAPGTYEVMVEKFSGSNAAVAEWTGAATVLTANGAPATDSPAQFDVLQAYEAHLIAGVPYTIQFSQPGTANRHLIVFANSGGGTYWAPRSAAIYDGTGNFSFTPGTTGDYAMVISNDAVEIGSYTVLVTSSVADVPDAPKSFVTRLTGAVPNPAHSDVAIRYSLAREAEVQLDLIDLTGRRVWSSDDGQRAAGDWSTSLPRVVPSHGRLSAGLYFVRFYVDGRLAGSKKVSLVD